MGQLPAIMLSDAAFCGMLRDSNRGPRFELCSSYQDPTIGTWLIKMLLPLGRLASGICERVARQRGRSSFCAVVLSMLKFGPVPPSGDRLQGGFLPASSLFSYEATQNRMQDPRIPKKVLTHNNVRPTYNHWPVGLEPQLVTTLCYSWTQSHGGDSAVGRGWRRCPN